MSILRITLAEWSDVGIPAAVVGETVGTALTGTLVATPTADGTVVDPYGRVQQFVKETATVDGSAPFTYDLLDPTDCMPSDWGWRISVRSNDDKRLTWMKTELPFAVIESYPQIDGVRTIPLETVAALATGDPDAPWVTPSVWIALEQSITDSAAASALSAQESQLSAGNSAAAASNSADSAYLAGQHSGTAHDWANAAGSHAGTATTQAGLATTQAGLATTARQGAETAQGLSETAKQGSEAARDDAIAKLLEASSITFTASAVDGEPGESAFAEVTGAAPDFGLGLVLPRGRDAFEAGLVPPTDTNKLWLDEGTPSLPETGSPFELRGYGMPNGVVAAIPGTYYTDVVGTNGAWRWLKTSGTGNTGWVVVIGDTGWRNVPNWSVNASNVVIPLAQGSLYVRRIGNLVKLVGRSGHPEGTGAAIIVVSALSQLRILIEPSFWGDVIASFSSWDSITKNMIRDPGAVLRLGDGGSYPWGIAAGARGVLQGAWTTSQPWPTTLPGTAV